VFIRGCSAFYAMLENIGEIDFELRRASPTRATISLRRTSNDHIHLHLPYTV
jgi:hypothetical protein